MSKQDKIDEVKANLPLPEQPPKPSDWNTADARPVGEAGVNAHLGTGPESTTGLRGPSINTPQAQEDITKIGREGVKESRKE